MRKSLTDLNFRAHHRRALAGLVAIWAVSASAQDAAEVKAAVPVLLKVLTYDINFDSRGVGDFVVLVANEPGQADKRQQLVDALKSVDVAKVKTRPVKYVGAEFKDEASLQAEIDRTHASALLAVPGMSDKFVTHLLHTPELHATPKLGVSLVDLW